VSTLAIVHPLHLLGKELREGLGRSPLGQSWHDVRLFSTLESDIGTLTEAGGAAAIVQRYEADSLEGVSVAFFCGGAAANRPLLADLPADTTAVLLSPDATLADGPPVVAGINARPSGDGSQILVSPHPAVVLLAHLLQPLAAFDLETAVATVVQPASMFDEAGVEDLFEQTRQIVAMTPRKRSPVFGAQLAFNLLPAAGGAEAAASIADSLAAVLAAPGARPPRTTVQIVQGGVFHGLALSLYVRCGSPANAQAVRKELTASPYVEAAADLRHLGPIDAAASDKVLLGALRKDDDGLWLWATMDNLTRGGALNALEIVAAVH
jgi:aspartate-semialdehyde dehydrogenase